MKLNYIIYICILSTSLLSASEKYLVDYIGLGLASQRVDNKNFNTGKSLILNAGKEQLYKNIGMEVEGTLQIDKPTATINNLSSDLKFWTMGMYGTYLWKIDSIIIKPRLGLVYESIKSSFNTDDSEPLKSIDKNKVGLSAGIGISYKLTEKSKLFTNYTKYEDDIEHLTFGAEFKF